MAGFRLPRRRFLLRRSQIMGRVRMNNRRVRPNALQLAAADQMEDVPRILNRELIDQISLINSLINQWINDRLVEVENDPLMKNAFKEIDAQNR